MKTWKHRTFSPRTFIGMAAILVLAFALVACREKDNGNKNGNGNGNGGGLVGTWKRTMPDGSVLTYIFYSGNTFEQSTKHSGGDDLSGRIKGTYTYSESTYMGSIKGTHIYDEDEEKWLTFSEFGIPENSYNGTFTLINNVLTISPGGTFTKQ